MSGRSEHERQTSWTEARAHVLQHSQRALPFGSLRPILLPLKHARERFERRERCPGKDARHRLHLAFRFRSVQLKLARKVAAHLHFWQRTSRLALRIELLDERGESIDRGSTHRVRRDPPLSRLTFATDFRAHQWRVATCQIG